MASDQGQAFKPLTPKQADTAFNKATARGMDAASLLAWARRDNSEAVRLLRAALSVGFPERGPLEFSAEQEKVIAALREAGLIYRGHYGWDGEVRYFPAVSDGRVGSGYKATSRLSDATLRRSIANHIAKDRTTLFTVIGMDAATVPLKESDTYLLMFEAYANGNEQAQQDAAQAKRDAVLDPRSSIKDVIAKTGLNYDAGNANDVAFGKMLEAAGFERDRFFAPPGYRHRASTRNAVARSVLRKLKAEGITQV